MMRFVRVLAAPVIATALVAPAGAQTAASPDPRVGLKAGLRDAGVAARGLELIANVPKPEGFFDPKAPAGEPNPRMPDEEEKKDDSDAKGEKGEKGEKTPPKPWGGLNFANSDLAFSGNHLFIGNFSGFNV